MRVITPVARLDAYTKIHMKNRKIITKYKDYNRCCYLLSNGKRCSRPVSGATRVGRNKVIFVMQCKQHAPECYKKYLTYKSLCGKVINKAENVRKLKAKKGGNLFNKIALLKNCQAGRVEYPQKCVMGCIKYPGSKLSKNLLQKRLRQHDFITQKLKELEHLLLYGNKTIRSPKKLKNNNVSYKLRNN